LADELTTYEGLEVYLSGILSTIISPSFSTFILRLRRRTGRRLGIRPSKTAFDDLATRGVSTGMVFQVESIDPLARPFRQVQDVWSGWSRVAGMQGNRLGIAMRAFWVVTRGYLSPDCGKEEEQLPYEFRPPPFPPSFSVGKGLSRLNKPTHVLKT